MKRTVLKLNLTAAQRRLVATQQREIVKIQNSIITERPETVGLALMDFALKFHEVYGFGIILGIASGEGPAELTAGSLQKLARHQSRNKRVHVELTTDELTRICGDNASELWNVTGLSYLVGFDHDDFAAVLAAWRAYAPLSVKNAVRCGTSWEDATHERRMHDEAADFLERMLAVKAGLSVAE